jgi:hypothetical protein
MKKIFILVLAFMFVSGVSLGATKRKSVEKTMEGNVETVTLADSAKGTKSEVKIVVKKSGEMTFLVKSTTTLWSHDFKVISLDKIKPDDKIKVKYTTTKEGVCEAVSIKIIK